MPPTNLFGLGYGVGPAGYGYPSVGRWSPLSLGSSLAAWYKADAGCYTDAACLFASASSQYLSRADAAALRATSTSFTLIAFVNPTDFLSFPGIVGKGSPDASGGEYALLFDTDGTVRARMRKADDSGFVDAASAAPISTGSYAMLEAYYDIDNGKVGLRVNNGTAVESTMVGGVFSGTSDFKVSNAGGAMLNGSVARVMLTKRLLTSAERTWLYNAGAGRFYADLGVAGTDGSDLKTSLVEYWNLCESSSTRVGSHAGLNLTPTNGPTVAAGPGEGAAVNNSPVKRWEDQSGNARHLVQATIANQPLWIASGQNGLPVVRGDGTSDYLVYTPLTLAQPLTWAGAFKYAGSGAGNQTLLYGTGGSTPTVYRRASGDTFAMFAGAETDATAADNSFHAHICTFNGSSSTYHIDGSALTLSGDPGAADFSAEDLSAFSQSSGGGYASADIGEAMLIGATPTAGQRGSIQGYLKPRWATP